MVRQKAVGEVGFADVFTLNPPDPPKKVVQRTLTASGSGQIVTTSSPI
jgi:hypothetical protein